MTASLGDQRKGIFWFLITSVLVTLAFRWPTMFHETGIDSFFVHTLANSAAEFGEIRWVVNPLSVFGLYPMSYASGMPILLAEFSNMSGFAMEQCFLVFSCIVAIISALTAFLLGMEIKNSPLFAFAVSVLYSASPLLLVWTEWTITTRYLFMALLPLTLWILLRLNRIEQKTSNVLDKRGMVALLLVNLFLLALIHNLFMMTILFILVFFVSKRVYKILSRPKSAIVMRRKGMPLQRVVTMSAVVFVIGFVAVVSYSLGWMGLESYESGVFQGNSDLTRFLNLLSSISATIGYPIAFLLPISLLITLKSRKRGFIGIFFLISFLFILPFSGGRTYERLLYPIVLGILILLPYQMLVLKKHQRIYIKAVAVALALTLPMNLLLVDHYNRWSETQAAVSDGPSTPDHTYMTAQFYSYYLGGEPFAVNNWLVGGQIQAYSNSPLSLWNDGILLIYGIIEPDSIDAKLNSIDEFFSSGGEIFSTDWMETLYHDYAFLFLYRSDPIDGKDIIDRYDIGNFIEDTRLNGKTMGYNMAILYPSGNNSAPFIVGMHQTTYKIYDNGIDIIWRIRT